MIVHPVHTAMPLSEVLILLLVVSGLLVGSIALLRYLHKDDVKTKKKCTKGNCGMCKKK